MKNLLVLLLLQSSLLFTQVNTISDKLAVASFEYQLNRFDQYVASDTLCQKKTLFFNRTNNSGFQRLREAGSNTLLFFSSKQRFNMYYIEEYFIKDNTFFVKEYYAHCITLHGKPFFWMENPNNVTLYKVQDWDTLSLHIKKVEIVIQYITSVLKRPHQTTIVMY